MGGNSNLCFYVFSIYSTCALINSITLFRDNNTWFIFFSCVYFGISSGSCYISLVLLTFAACEASVGLSLLVALIRSHGKDLMSTFVFLGILIFLIYCL